MEKSAVFFAYTKKCTMNNACIQFSNAAWVAVLVGIFMFCAIFMPYIIVLCRGTMNPLLPFISAAAGSPPQSGIFSIFLALSAAVGFLGLHLLHLGICVFENRVPKEKKRLLQFLNTASLFPGHLALLGMIIVGGFPVDFHRHNEDWILVTIGPHLAGALLLFGCGVVYCSILTKIMTIIFPQKKKLLGIRIFLLTTTIVTALIHFVTVLNAFKLEYYDEDRLKLCHLKPYEYDTNYLVCTSCEWLMAIAFVSTLITLREEAKLISFTVAVDLLENSSETQADISESPSSSNISSESTRSLVQKTQTAAEDDQNESSRKS